MDDGRNERGPARSPAVQMTTAESPRGLRLSRSRTLLFSVMVVGGTLGGTLVAMNELTEWMELRGLIHTNSPGVSPRSVEEPLWREGNDGRFHATAYARQTMVDSPFQSTRSGRHLIFVLGESWAMGTPYVHQGQDREGAGGVPFWLRRAYSGASAGAGVDIVNAAAGGQDSSRVAEVAEEALRYRPDVYLPRRPRGGYLQQRSRAAALDGAGALADAWRLPPHEPLAR